MVTALEWFTHYHKDYYIERPKSEDIAWGVIDCTGWPASPELLMYLTKYIDETIAEQTIDRD